MATEGYSARHKYKIRPAFLSLTSKCAFEPGTPCSCSQLVAIDTKSNFFVSYAVLSLRTLALVRKMRATSL